jgi:hypothetical protein
MIIWRKLLKTLSPIKRRKVLLMVVVKLGSLETKIVVAVRGIGVMRGMIMWNATQSAWDQETIRVIVIGIEREAHLINARGPEMEKGIDTGVAGNIRIRREMGIEIGTGRRGMGRRETGIEIESQIVIRTKTGENVAVRVRGTGRESSHVEAGVDQKGIGVTMTKERGVVTGSSEKEKGIGS